MLDRTLSVGVFFYTLEEIIVLDGNKTSYFLRNHFLGDVHDGVVKLV